MSCHVMSCPFWRTTSCSNTEMSIKMKRRGILGVLQHDGTTRVEGWSEASGSERRAAVSFERTASSSCLVHILAVRAAAGDVVL